jgi:hypothetical protein
MAIRKGKNAKPTQIHENKKRWKRKDKYKGKEYSDWHEQQVKELDEANGQTS